MKLMSAYLDRYKEDGVEVEVMNAVQQVVGVEARGGTTDEGGSARTNRERGRWQLGCWSLPRRR